MNKNTLELLKEDPKRLFQMMADNRLLKPLMIIFGEMYWI